MISKHMHAYKMCFTCHELEPKICKFLKFHLVLILNKNEKYLQNIVILNYL